MTDNVQLNILLPRALRGALDGLAATRSATACALGREAIERFVRSQPGTEPGLEDDWAAHRRLAGSHGRLAGALAEVHLDVGEAHALVDVLNGGLLAHEVGHGLAASSVPTMLYAEVSDACWIAREDDPELELSALGHKWWCERQGRACDGRAAHEARERALLAKLRALSPLQALAMVDAVDRWWSLDVPGTGHVDLLRAVGLVAPDDAPAP